MRRQIFILLCIFQGGYNQACSDGDRLNGANIALRKRTAQSTTYAEYGVLHTSSLAVDGDILTDWNHGSCSSTDVSQIQPAWWSVDLGEERILKKVIIYNRNDQKRRLRGATVIGYAANGTGFTISTSLPDMEIIELDIIPLNLIRNVTIVLLAKSSENENILNICEVQVFENLNIARDKSTQQSSVYVETSKIYGSQLAVDGDESGVFSGGSCTATVPLTGANLMLPGNVSWSVDLGREYLISYIKVFNRKDDESRDITRRLGYFTVMASTATNRSILLYQELRADPGKEIDIPLYAHITVPVKIISLSIPRHVNTYDNVLKGNILTICEFEAYRAITCPIYRLENGNIQEHTMGDNKKNYTYCATLTLNCDRGYHFNFTEMQSLTTTCQSNGTWTTLAHCKDINECTTKATPCHNHGQCFNTDGDYSCVCDTGYTGSRCESDIDECTTMATACHSHGQCSNTDGGFSCRCGTGYTGSSCESVVRCDELRLPEFGTRLLTEGIEGNWTYNTTVAVECYPGYSLNGAGRVKCMNFGQWNGTLGNCSVISCHIPDIDPKKGIYELRPVLVGNISYSSFLTIKCKEGYRLIGSDIIWCTGAGEWDASIGQCIVIQCSGPIILPNNSMHLYEEGIEGNLTYNSTISIRCQEGYKISGTDLIRCNEFGVWDRLFGTCHVIDCGWPEDVPHDVPLLIMPGIAGGFSYNATACIKSNEGVQTFGDMYESLRCSSEGYWRGSLRKCFETTKKEAYMDDDGKKVILPVAVLVPICLILIATIIVTLLKHHRHACYRGQPSEQIQTGMTIADQFGSNQNEITKRQHTRLIYTKGDIELQRRKSVSEETQCQGTGPYDELQKEHRENSEYDELKFKRDLTSNKGTMYENADEFAHI